MRQTSFGFLKNYKKEFGGALLVGKRKLKRPLSTKHPIHMVLKTDAGGLFNPGNRSLEKLIYLTAQEFNVKIYDLALNWNHIHFLFRIYHREDYVRFVRALTSRMVASIRQSRPRLKGIFSLRPFTRILSWGRDFKMALQYLILNQMEGRGLLKRKKVSCQKKKAALVRPLGGTFKFF